MGMPFEPSAAKKTDAAGLSLKNGSVAFGIRNRKGEWQPPYPAEYAPIFVWPPRPRQLLRWLLAYPGFLWPWNSVYLLVTLMTWFLLQPALSRCAHLQADWIGLMYLRNLGLLWLVSGGWHLALYSWKVQGTERKYDPRWPSVNDPKFLFRNQTYDNIFWSCVSGCTVWTAYEALYMWACANHRVPYVDWRSHPVYCSLWLCAIPFWRELHFYWIHRAIHWPPLYRAVHYLHHKNVNPEPWSGLAMHPVEHILYFSVVLIHWVIPGHPIHFLFNAQHTALTPAAGHDGFEGPVLKGRLPGGSYFHYLHHRFFNCNYGEATLPLDRWFGTFRPRLFDPSEADRQPQVHAETGAQG
jgi:sterol desaturase/sphingolipid hydroxylase (fatty acid hydroxylase superfamily)